MDEIKKLFNIMRFLIIQPSWDHTEVLGSLLYYIKYNNYNLDIIFNWSVPHNNFIDYYSDLFDLKYNKITYSSPKHHQKIFIAADVVIFVDEIHLKKFMSKNIYRLMLEKCYTFNHITSVIQWKIKTFSLGYVPYNYSKNVDKILINSYFNSGKNIDLMKDLKKSNKKKYLIVGNPSHRVIKYLEKLDEFNLNMDIYFVIRKDLDLDMEIDNKNVTILKNLDTKKLFDLIDTVDFIITLFKCNSVYHKDRISGIIPLAISFCKPIIMDQNYKEINNFTFKNISYENNFDDFKKKIENTISMSDSQYCTIISDMLSYRNKNIKIQLDNFKTIFN